MVRRRRTALEERAAGCLLGLALGDALGAPFEFSRASELPRPLPILALPWRGGPPGSTTDDTALARNLCRSLAERGGLDPDDLLARHVEWFRSSPPDVGNMTRAVLRRVERGERASDAARAIWERRGPEVSAGNGSVMYCAPLGVAYANRPDELTAAASELSALTHFDPRCRTACVAVTTAVAALARGEGRTHAARVAVEAVLELDGGEELEFLIDAVGSSRPIDGPDQGFCLFAAAAGLRALVRGGTFDEGLLSTVALGGDTDTNGAVAGALLGTASGVEALPAGWLDLLGDRAAIEAEGRALGRATMP
jgi:ADP-ribosyl-[dinitrogen reductase] hydrolase